MRREGWGEWVEEEGKKTALLRQVNWEEALSMEFKVHIWPCMDEQGIDECTRCVESDVEVLQIGGRRFPTRPMGMETWFFT